jgi:outer membrane protein, multidrug efflux system
VTRPVLTLMAASLLASACNVGPDYQTPQIPVDAAFAPGGAAAPGSAATGVQWWRVLQDDPLDKLIAVAVDNNLDLRQAQARILEARAQRAVVAGGEWPAVEATAGYQWNRLSQNARPYNAFTVPGFPWEFSTYQMGFDAAWEIDFFGGTRRTVEAADASLQARQEDLHAVLVTLQAEVARNYIELRSFQRQRSLAQHNLELQNQTLALTKDRLKNGVGSDLDVSRAQALVAATAAEVPLYDRGEWQALHRLAVLTHQPLDSLLDLRTEAPIPTAPAAVMAGVPADLLRRRPDIRRAERELAAATARVGSAQADLYPKLSLSGVFSLQSATIEDLWNWRSRMFSLGPTISWPIFEAGRLHAVVSARNAQQEQVLTAYEQTVQAAIQEVRDQMVTFATERRRQEALAQAVTANRDSLDLGNKLYAQGLTDFLTVLDAQRQVDQAENALARSQAVVDESLIALYKALGGGWQNEAPANTQVSPQEVP